MPNILLGRDIVERIKQCARKSKSVKIAAPFWGKGAVERLGLHHINAPQSATHQIICNLESGACNPGPIKDLIDRHWNVRSNPRLHAKVYLFSDVAILGSSNPSTNGLTEDLVANAGWHEVCVELDDESNLQALRKWFASQATPRYSTVVNATALKIAELRFARTRNAVKQAKVDSADSSLFDVLNSPDRSWAENLNVWIYDEQTLSNMTHSQLRAAQEEHNLPSDEGYEVDVDPMLPEWVDYGPTIIDCELTTRKRVFEPALYELHTKYSKEVEPDLWALPATLLMNKGALRLDAESKKYIRRLVQSFLKQHPERLNTSCTIKDLEDLE